MIGANTYWVQIKVKPGAGSIKLTRNRWIQEHGLFGPVHMVHARQALDLIDRGLVKLRPGMSVARLRDEVAAADA